MLSTIAVIDLGHQTWFWATTVVIVVVLVALNLALLVGVHVRNIREASRARRAVHFRELYGHILDVWAEYPPTESELESTRQDLPTFTSIQRDVAAESLIAQLRDASPEERARTLERLRQVGAIDFLFESLRRRVPWRRTLAIRLLGHAGADEAVPLLVERIGDRNRYVRNAAVRALGRIGDTRAIEPLSQVFLEPGRIVPGTAYEALLAFGQRSAPVFREGLRSPNQRVRVASAFGVGSVLDPAEATPLLTPRLADESPLVRAGAAQMLGRIGGDQVTDELARAARDDERSVRRAAVSALAGYDDPQAAELAARALDDPDRDTVMHAGETLVRLSRLSRAGPAAKDAVAEREAWPIERAQILASLGAL